jgi:threonine synthase
LNAAPLSRLVCAGCGATPPPDEPYPFRCPRADAGDGADHVLRRELDFAQLRFPRDPHRNPFVRYRTLLHSYHRALAGGASDADFVGWVEELDRRIAAVEGRGFVVTPFASNSALGDRLGMGPGGPLWIKDETGNVAGTHKARHLFGLALHLEVAERLGLTSRAESDRRGLAIASCGNAALAAATLARATGRPLQVFIPTDANPRVVTLLEALGAAIAVCPRVEGETGDPCYHAFRRALAAGALPFCCQGPDNGLTIEGGSTLAWEMVSALAGLGLRLDRLFIQVGGGALASACAEGLREAVELRALRQPPRLHAVQTAGAFPLLRAYGRVRARVLARLGVAVPGEPDGHVAPARDETLADRMLAHAGQPEVEEELAYARSHRAEFMWPWETTPASIAHGILDDETYDWHSVVSGMIRSGGYPLAVTENRLREGCALAASPGGHYVDATAAAGLAGLAELRAHRLPTPGSMVAVLFTGGSH